MLATALGDGRGAISHMASPEALDTFETIVAERPGPRGDASTREIDLAPPVLGELAAYFGKLTPGRLAGVWVACVVDACVGSDLSPGDMARALVVVAERLHGVKFQEQPVVLDPRHVRGSGAPSAPAHPAASPSSQPQQPAVKAAATPSVVGKYQLHTGEPPESAGRKTKYAECIAACVTLPVSGGWFEWIDGPKVFSSPALSKKLSKAAGCEILVYRSTGGKVIVKRIAKQ